MAAWKRKKHPSLINLAVKQLPSHDFALKIDKFVFKVKPKKKPCSIAPPYKSGLSNIPGSSMQITISYFVQLVMLLWITTESQFLTNTFQMFHTSSEWMNPLRSERNNRH